MKGENNMMKQHTAEKVEETLRFISQDRILADDPFFTTRMMARAEKEFPTSVAPSGFSVFYGRLRPLFAAATIVIGLAAGVFLGTQLSRNTTATASNDRTAVLQQLAQEDFITGINGSPEEQLLSK